jgi:hypothetical protein
LLCPSVTNAEYISSNVQAWRMASISPFLSNTTCARADTQTCGCAAAAPGRTAAKTAAGINNEQKRQRMKGPSAAHFAEQSPAVDRLLRGRLYGRASLAEERRKRNASRHAVEDVVLRRSRELIAAHETPVVMSEAQ